MSRSIAATSRRGGRRGLSLSGLAASLALLVAAGGGMWWWMRTGDTGDDLRIILHTVKRADFVLNVTERGEVEAYDVTEVRSLVKTPTTTGSAILRLVPEGTQVTKGDFLVELDSSALVEQRTTQQIAVNTAKALEVEAHNTYDTAVIAKREYLEGTNLQERQLIESEKFVAEENLNRAKEYYAYSKKLASKGYVNELQLEADRFAVEKANKDLETAKTKLHVLDEFTKPKMVSTLEAAIQIAQAKWDSAQNSYALEKGKLDNLDDQIAKCTITAPQAGIVKYAHVLNGRGDQEFIVEEGAVVRERQAVIRLPNADSMRVNVTVNESLVQYVRTGAPAVINPTGFGDRVFHGTVDRVNQYAEPVGWRQAQVKEYKAFVTIDDPSLDLRTGMTAAVTIRCEEIPDALQVPVQAMYAHGNKFYCFVYSGGRLEARQVKAGPTNDKFFVIESGLNEGDQVAMNPRGYLDQVSLPKLSPEEAQRAVPQRKAGGPPGQGPGRGAPGGVRPEGGPHQGPPQPGEMQQPNERPPGQPGRPAPGDTRVPNGSGAAGQARTAAANSPGAAQ